MGTNYYHHPTPQPCPTCGHDPSEVVHIGKHSGGWKFSFHGTEIIRSWEQWSEAIYASGKVFDEYCLEYTADEFSRVVESSSGRNQHDYYSNIVPDDSVRHWKDSDGYSFSTDEFS